MMVVGETSEAMVFESEGRIDDSDIPKHELNIQILQGGVRNIWDMGI